MKNFNKKILIIGGSGFLGSNLFFFLKENYNVCIGIKPGENLLKENSELNLIEIDLNNEKSLLSVLSNFDTVINSAGANSDICNSDIVYGINSYITLKALIGKAAIKSGVERIINFSTAHVYGKLEGLIDENVKPFNINPYAFLHLAGELTLKNVVLNTNTKLINMRLGNIFGFPKLKNDHCWKLFTNDLCKQAILNKKMIIKNNYMQERNFLGIKDFCEIVEFFINCPRNKILFDTYNIGSKSSMSLKSMAILIQKQISKELNFYPEIVYESEPERKEKLYYSISRLSEIYKNQFNIENDIKELINLLST